MTTGPQTADEWQDAIHDGFRAESDRGAALVAAAMLDTALEALLVKRLVPPEKPERSLFQAGSGPLGPFSAKIDAAHQMGLISGWMARDLHLIRKIRNYFAHHALECTFATPQVCDWVRALERASEYNRRVPETRDAVGPPGGRWDFLGIVSWMLYALNRALEDVTPLTPRGPEFGYIDFKQLPEPVRKAIGMDEET